MRENESLHQMMSRLATLTNELTSLENIITTEEQVKKVLKVYPIPNGMLRLLQLGRLRILLG